MTFDDRDWYPTDKPPVDDHTVPIRYWQNIAGHHTLEWRGYQFIVRSEHANVISRYFLESDGLLTRLPHWITRKNRLDEKNYESSSFAAPDVLAYPTVGLDLHD